MPGIGFISHEIGLFRIRGLGENKKKEFDMIKSMAASSILS